MASDWVQNQEEGWLGRLLEGDSGAIAKKSTLWQLYRIFENTMTGKASAKDSASKTASLVSSEPKAWYDVIGIYVTSAEKIADEDALKALVDYIVELASLPDAINESHETVVIDHIGHAGASVPIEPGETLVMGYGGKRLWKDLPDLIMEITERFQVALFVGLLVNIGPEQYLSDTPSPADLETAKTLWKNFNTFLALRATSDRAQTIPVLANGVRMARMTLATALEHSPNTRKGKKTDLHIPAAEAWFRIAGDEIEKLCEAGTETLPPGDLWASQGGGDVCDSARLEFWKSRMSELGAKYRERA
ncbi:hypothetical protein J4E86_002864 [Alternaria arbusti]|uniref:uncharacterized protein n=1 Tax=Alternaria arbusti TaxID=232088 RepID=UPI00221EFED3|nr:uncharacterized protein J4E86_002864 [Alternaria arbusti]KAI4959143.1 hypothetical protein J4E86_002864 [Alternaria arbusti]